MLNLLTLILTKTNMAKDIDESFKDAIGAELESKINDAFNFSHELAGTKSGDISPDQQLELDDLTEKLKNLIIRQTAQNL